MKRTIWILLATGLLAAAAARAEKVQLSDLPTRVQSAIKAQTGGSAVEDIDKTTREGKTTYEVAFKKNGQHTELVFNEDGSLVSDAKGAAASVSSESDSMKSPLSGATKVEMQNLPVAVQNAIRQEAGRNRIEDIDKGTVNGQTVYQAAFKKDNKHIELRVSEDAKVLGRTGARVAPKATSTTPAPRAEVKKAEKDLTADLPAAVRAALKQRGGTVKDVDRDTLRGKTVYEVEFAEGNKTKELHFSEDGTVLEDQWADLLKQPLSSGTKTELSELPPVVQRAIRSQTGSARIEDLERGTVRGRVYYEAAFKRNGQHTELRVAEDGQILNVFEDSRANALSLTDLPTPVQNKARAQIGTNPVLDVDKEMHDGHVVYEIEFEQGNVSKEIRLGEDGSLIPDDRASR